MTSPPKIRKNVQKSEIPSKYKERTEELTKYPNSKNVLYITARDQRIFDNYCVNLGFELSEQNKSQFYMGCELNNLKMNERQKAFVVQGLKVVEKDAEKFNINLFLLKNDLEEFCKKKTVDCIILDFFPLREYLKRAEEIRMMGERNKIRVIRVDTHNLVPCRKLDVYKRTGASVKIHLNKQWPCYFGDMPDLKPHKFNKLEKINNLYPEINEKLFKYKGGYQTGMKMFDEFCKSRFSNYADQRNNPNVTVSSNLSPWVTFGQISPQKIIFLIYKKFVDQDKKNLESFLNEFFIWRETAEHFVYHEKNYDNINGALDWAKYTLLHHKQDKRKFRYKTTDIEKARTKDELWNAAQKELVLDGKMHSYVRMYWCKTLLQWFDDPEEALAFSINLNDSYSIDGNSPGGYLGCMWSICGSMDRAFKEREIVGKIRPMKTFKCPRYTSKFKDQEIK
ncbi:Deoxyribodipyrimidine photo-lyase [Nucleospora cyclopteri]